MDSAIRELLERVRHELVTLSGLEVCDGAAPGERWRLDERALIAEIDKMLPPGPGPWIEPLPPLMPGRVEVAFGCTEEELAASGFCLCEAEPVAAFGERVDRGAFGTREQE